MLNFLYSSRGTRRKKPFMKPRDSLCSLFEFAAQMLRQRRVRFKPVSVLK
jgi:hypothetical protein